MAKILLAGIDRAVSFPIIRALAAGHHTIESKPIDVSPAEAARADVILAAGEEHSYLNLLRAVHFQRPGLPFIVVSRLPETSQWLDALEAGATDYCAAPFEPIQLQWILDTALHNYRPPAVAA